MLNIVNHISLDEISYALFTQETRTKSTNTRLKNLCFAFVLLSWFRWLWHSYIVLVLMFVLFVPQEYLHCLMFCFDLVNDYILDHIGIRKHDDRICVRGVLHPK